jgi:hypothetical protein
MRAEPPPPRRRGDHPQPDPRTGTRPLVRRRCPYLEQVLREKAGPFGMLVRYKADCHVDRRTHRFTGRNPHPPCINDPATCSLYRSARDGEDQRISRYTD